MSQEASDPYRDQKTDCNLEVLAKQKSWNCKQTAICCFESTRRRSSKVTGWAKDNPGITSYDSNQSSQRWFFLNYCRNHIDFFDCFVFPVTLFNKMKINMKYMHKWLKIVADGCISIMTQSGIVILQNPLGEYCRRKRCLWAWLNCFVEPSLVTSDEAMNAEPWTSQLWVE